jgi:streptogramin lyase
MLPAAIRPAAPATSIAQMELLESRQLLSSSSPTFSEIALATGSSPQKVVIGKEGSIYVYEHGTDKLVRQLPNTSKPFTEFDIPTETNQHFGMAVSKQGDVYFTIDGGIGAFSPRFNTVRTIDLGSNTADMAAGADKQLWFTLPDLNKIGRLTLIGSRGHPTGEFDTFDVPTAHAGLASITTGPNNDLWFGEDQTGKIGHIILGKNGAAPTIEEFDLPSGVPSHAVGITTGPDKNIWFAEVFSNKIGTINEKTHAITEFNVPTANSEPFWITTGPDKNLWFVERATGKVGQITTGGNITEFDTPSGSGAFLTSIVNYGRKNTLWYTAADTDKFGKIVL